MIDLDCCNSPYRLRYWNLLTFADGNTDSISVATALTVYGIETSITPADLASLRGCNSPYRLRYWNKPTVLIPLWLSIKLQQPLPFTVLKRSDMMWYRLLPSPRCNSPYRLRYWNSGHSTLMPPSISVATVLIVYGIETWTTINSPPSSLLKLQQYLLFTVLKHSY